VNPKTKKWIKWVVSHHFTSMIHTSAIYSKASLAEFPDAVEVDLHWKTMDGSNVGWFLVFDVFFSTNHT
jgi:pyoverdine/dityrosine biosynthesis protein Dit1